MALKDYLSAHELIEERSNSVESVAANEYSIHVKPLITRIRAALYKVAADSCDREICDTFANIENDIDSIMNLYHEELVKRTRLEALLDTIRDISDHPEVMEE